MNNTKVHLLMLSDKNEIPTFFKVYCYVGSPGIRSITQHNAISHYLDTSCNIN